MSFPGTHESDPSQAGTSPDGGPPTRNDPAPGAVRRQLARILDSQSFRNSRRYSSFLKHVVESTLTGRGEDLKERNVGVEVFDKPPDFDTGTDHSVRSAASEVRKRLAQYYAEPGHESEIRIELHPGSYVPEFRTAEQHALSAQPDGSSHLEEPEPHPRRAGNRKVLAPLVAFAAGFAIAGILFWTAPWHSKTVLDRFWKPVLEASSYQILLCVGFDERPSAVPLAPEGPAAVASLVDGDGDAGSAPQQSLAVEDAITVAKLAGLLQGKGSDFRVLSEPSTRFDDLRDHAPVLIGALNNDWALQLLGRLRFRFEGAGSEASPVVIRDTQNDSSSPPVVWVPVRSNEPGSSYSEDYAIVARYRDPETMQFVVVASGTHAYGTAAAGEFLTSPDSMRQILDLAPDGWEEMNLQIVLSTNVTRGVAGAPKIVAAHFW